MARKRKGTKKARFGRTAKGRIKPGYYLSCNGPMKAAKSTRTRKRRRR